jgi:hypothetical protein
MNNKEIEEIEKYAILTFLDYKNQMEKRGWDIGIHPLYANTLHSYKNPIYYAHLKTNSKSLSILDDVNSEERKKILSGDINFQSEKGLFVFARMDELLGFSKAILAGV